jgi:hypothetical protein
MWFLVFVEKLRKSVDIVDDFRLGRLYACAPNLTDTSFDTPGSCMVTP